MYRLNETQQRLVGEVEAIAVKQIGPDAVQVDRDGAFPRESIAALGRAGLLGLT
ncbi:MAG: acyl-CoA dehydrogenase family protein, partial [Acidobacteria bacterium]|nr:acyl-CoA dehydrogenase family protein [Acidobacteriota bacterium]